MQAAGLFVTAMLLVGPQQQPEATDVVGPFNCKVEAVEREGILVSSRLLGFMDKLHVQRGDSVKKDQVLAQLDNREAQLEVKIRRERANNDVNLRFAEFSNKVAEARVLKMNSANLIVESVFPEMVLKEAELEERRSFFQGEQAKYNQLLETFELQRAEMNLSFHEIKSPVSGIVTEVLRYEGEVVRQGEPLLKLLRSDRLRVQGQLTIKDYPKVRRGLPVEVRVVIRDADADLPVEKQLYRGTILAINPRVHPGPDATTFEVMAEVDNHDGQLLPGFNAEMVIHLSSAPGGSSGVAKRRIPAANP